MEESISHKTIHRIALTLGLSAALVLAGLGTASAKAPDTSGPLSVSGMSTASAAKDKENHCIVPDGPDLNELFGASEQIVVAIFSDGTSAPCTNVGSGERWRPSVIAWGMNQTFEVVPDGFTPAGATPLEDFVAKFAGVRYVVDPGTSRERTYRFTNVGDLWTAAFDGFSLASPVTLAALGPLPAGDHEVETYWTFTAVHCDGLGDGIVRDHEYPDQTNCFRTGETQLPTIEFEVTPGRY